MTSTEEDLLRELAQLVEEHSRELEYDLQPLSSEDRRFGIVSIHTWRIERLAATIRVIVDTKGTSSCNRVRCILSVPPSRVEVLYDNRRFTSHLVVGFVSIRIQRLNPNQTRGLSTTIKTITRCEPV